MTSNDGSASSNASTANRRSLLSHFGLFKDKVPSNLLCQCFHSILDAALRQISAPESPADSITTPSPENFDPFVWKLSLDEFLLLRDDLVALLHISRNAIGAQTKSHSLTQFIDSLLKEGEDLLGRDLIRLILICIETRTSDIDSAFKSHSGSAPSRKRRLDDIDWRVDFILSSDKCVRIDEPRASVDLRLVEGDGSRERQRAGRRKGVGCETRGFGWKRKSDSGALLVRLDLSLGEIRSLVASLTQAADALDNLRA